MARDFPGTGSPKISLTLKAGQTSLAQTSYSFLMYPDSNNQYRGVFNKKNGYPDREANTEYDDGFNAFVYTQLFDGARGGWSIAKPATGAWHQIVITHDMSSATNDAIIYKDGASQTVTERYTPSGTASNTSTALMIGKSNNDGDNGNNWDGLIAEFAIWNRILSADEAAGLGKRLSPLHFMRGLVLYMPITGRFSPDIEVIQMSNGTITGTLNYADHPRIILPRRRNYMPMPPGVAPATSIKDLIGGFGFIPFPR